jgi:hypothetical protein
MIETVLDKSPFATESSPEDGTATMVRTPSSQEHSKPTTKAKNKNRKDKNGKMKVMPMAKIEIISGRTIDKPLVSTKELIRTLVLALHAESLQLALPCTIMYIECWKLLRRAKDRCDKVLREVFTSAYMEREIELPFLVGWILMGSSGSDAIPDSRLLKGSAAVLNEMIGSPEGTHTTSLMRQIGFQREHTIKE